MISRHTTFSAWREGGTDASQSPFVHGRPAKSTAVQRSLRTCDASCSRGKPGARSTLHYVRPVDNTAMAANPKPLRQTSAGRGGKRSHRYLQLSTRRRASGARTPTDDKNKKHTCSTTSHLEVHAEALLVPAVEAVRLRGLCRVRFDQTDKQPVHRPDALHDDAEGAALAKEPSSPGNIIILWPLSSTPGKR